MSIMSLIILDRLLQESGREWMGMVWNCREHLPTQETTGSYKFYQVQNVSSIKSGLQPLEVI